MIYGASEKEREKHDSKAQTSIEIIVILSMILVVSLVLIATYGDFSSFIPAKGETTTKAYWKHAEVGITGLYLDSNETRIYLLNNQRQSVTVVNISINNISMGLDSNKTLSPGTSDRFSSSTTFRSSSKHYITIHYFVNGSDEVISFSGGGQYYPATFVD